MNITENIYKKSFIKAIISAICLVIGMLIASSILKQSSPNLLILGLMSFTVFYLIWLLIYIIKKKLIHQ
ncbi:hypothetical protein [Clostridium sporogenes]|uniref:hypothetical protein n=1 Tax=Clostridium sporogenes TaxID=1509 RepID=UPI0013D4679D|nr:hypothetical protein [Clostridium sporogenes]NFH41466.1 hypothetical protein [Clostridium sporogenes]